MAVQATDIEQSCSWIERCENILAKGLHLFHEELVLTETLLRNCIHYGVITECDDILHTLLKYATFNSLNANFAFFLSNTLQSDTEKKGPPKRFSLFLALLNQEQYNMVSFWKDRLKKHDMKNNDKLKKYWYNILQKGERILKKPMTLETIQDHTIEMIRKIHKVSNGFPSQRPRLPNNVGTKFHEFIQSQHDKRNDKSPLLGEEKKNMKVYSKGFEVYLLYIAKQVGATTIGRHLFKDIYKFPDLSYFSFSKDTEYIQFILFCVAHGVFAPYHRLIQLVDDLILQELSGIVPEWKSLTMEVTINKLLSNTGL